MIDDGGDIDAAIELVDLVVHAIRKVDVAFGDQAVDDGIVGEGFDGKAFLAHQLQRGGNPFGLHSGNTVDVLGGIAVDFLDSHGFLEARIAGDCFQCSILLSGIAEHRHALNVGAHYFL